MSDKLENCPFCGSTPIHGKYGKRPVTYFVLCPNLEAHQQITVRADSTNEAAAIAAWNRRPASDSALEQDNERLKALIAISDLEEVPASRIKDQGGHPVIKNAGTMLVPRKQKAEIAQRTRDLQKMAALARENHELKERLAAALASATPQGEGKGREVL